VSRKGPSKIKKILPDSTYQSVLVSKIVNYVMLDGKKNVARQQTHQALDLVHQQNPKKDTIELLDLALDNIKPRVEVRPRRIGGAVYQVPSLLRTHRQNSLAIRWLVQSARRRPNKQFHTFAQKLAAEILDALQNKGEAVAKRVEVERMAEANKAFSHLKW